MISWCGLYEIVVYLFNIYDADVRTLKFILFCKVLNGQSIFYGVKCKESASTCAHL